MITKRKLLNKLKSMNIQNGDDVKHFKNIYPVKINFKNIFWDGNLKQWRSKNHVSMQVILYDEETKTYCNKE